VAAAGVAVAAVVLLVPSFANWHMEDDLRTLRWVLEYRDRPWVALTELHSLHDHVRPATLLATWAGATLSDGAWWGPHLVLLALQLAGLGGLAVLAARLAHNPWAGVAAAALALTLPGYEAMAGWNAWICTAGEVAFGLWGLVALHRALAGGRWPVLGPVLLLVAGLFKEPGWVVYPLAAAGLVWLAWRAGQRGKHLVAGLIPLPVGLVGLVVTWHPANVYRTAEAPTPWAARALLGVLEQGRAMVDLWPAAVADGHPWWSGLSLPLLALAGWGLFRLPRRSAAGAVILATGVGVMLPFESVNAVQVLAAGYGLCLLVGLAASRGRRLPVALLALLAVGLVHEGIELGLRLADPAPREAWLANRARGDRFGGTAAFVRAVGAEEAVLDGPLDDLVLAPLFGLRLREDGDRRGVSTTLDGRLQLVADDRALTDALLEDDRVAGRDIPLLRPREEGRRRPGGRRGGGEAQDDVGLAIDGLMPGFHALGLVLARDVVFPADVQLEGRDACGGRAVIDAPVTRWSAATLRIRAGCSPLRLTWSGADRDRVERAFFVPLPHPEPSLRRARIHHRRLATPEQREVPPIFGSDVD